MSAYVKVLLVTVGLLGMWVVGLSYWKMQHNYTLLLSYTNGLERRQIEDYYTENADTSKKILALERERDELQAKLRWKDMELRDIRDRLDMAGGAMITNPTMWLAWLRISDSSYVFDRHNKIVNVIYHYPPFTWSKTNKIEN
jgi:hypothetical protein